ncbi:MAG: transglutaminase family protein [Gammaproteobacteria bacterium]|nr:transglutaminase family protein [Gammaproteobacteria bacterium]MCP5459504.1 transglutaminase family protein [Gammaproteobacteria bacterium]
MDYLVTHRTIYTYSGVVALCHNEARLLPRRLPWQRCADSRIEVHPRPALQLERLDFFGNRVLYFGIQDIHQELEVAVKTRVRVSGRPLSDQPYDRSWEAVRQALWQDPDPEIIEARQFVLNSPFVPATNRLIEYVRDSFTAGRPLLEAVNDLNHRIHEDFTFDPHFTTLATPLEEVLESRRGVCQDFAHLGIGCLRSLGLAARYVSGYLETVPPPGQPRLVGADASHAWLAVYLPGMGWVEFDPTNDCLPGEQHITLAWGRDYSDVAPLKGVMSGGGAHSLQVAVDVEPLPKSLQDTGGEELLFASDNDQD